MPAINRYYRYLLLIASYWCCLSSATAQQHQYLLKGFIGIQGGESFNYRLELKDSAGNILSGYSYTYQDEQHDVKTYVVAEVDRDRKTLKVREQTIVYNNYFQSKALICLVDALLTFSNTEHSLSGPLTTMTAGNGADCSKGSITFSNTEQQEQLFHPKAPKQPVAAVKSAVVPDKSKPVRVIYDTIPKTRRSIPSPQPPVTVIKRPESITEGQDKSYNWQSDNIILEVWDGNNEDNDRITILLNGTEILKDYTLTKVRKKLSLPVGGNELNIITILAVNEGGDPPNTANILLTDNDQQYEIVAHNTVGKKALIRIRKKL